MAGALPQGQDGLVVNIIDQRVWRPTPKFFSYTLSKSALWAATRTMAQAYAPRIRVNAIGPGSIDTEILATSTSTPAARRTVLSRIPMQRLGATDEVAKVAVFLASDDSSYVTGQTVYADGGRLALNYTVAVKE
jgi:NAD(P)-dependent dehydrogenase (short-subunit alcohol dehydrogenase family)